MRGTDKVPWGARGCQGYFWTDGPGGVVMACELPWKGKTTLDRVTTTMAKKSQMGAKLRKHVAISKHLGLAARA